MGTFFASYPSLTAAANPSVGPNGNPIPGEATLIGGENPTGNLEPLQTDSSGNLLVSIAAEPLTPLNTKDAADGTPGSPPPALAIQVAGTDGTDLRVLSTTTTGQLNVAQASAAALNATVVGSGVAGTPAGGVLSIQGVSGGTNVNVALAASSATVTVSGTVTANQGSANATPWNENVAQWGGSATSLGSKVSVSSVPVVIASDQGAVAVAETTAGSSSVTSVNASASNVTLLASNTSRKGATFFNDSTAILYLKLGTAASTTSYTVQLQANSYYELPFIKTYTGEIDGIWSSATGAVRVTELS